MNNGEHNIAYAQRAVAFVDILGWGKSVGASVESADMRKRLHNAVWALGEITKKDSEDDSQDYLPRDRAGQFSDNVIISVPFTGPNDLLRLVRQIAGYQQTMMMSGFLLRGGITVGPMFHEGSLAFGPALNAAYCLENERAHSPRVVIDKALARQVDSLARLLPKHWPFVRTDADGYYYLDYLTALAKSRAAAAQMTTMIARRLEEFSGEATILEKYRWLWAKWEEVNQDLARTR